MANNMAGDCQCGAVRNEVSVEPETSYLCHCQMCQRATGDIPATFVSCKESDRKWTVGYPEYYHSSAIAKRPYCAKCGTPLGFESLEGEYCDITIGSFDDLSVFSPSSHFGVEHLQQAWFDTRKLLREWADEHEPTIRRWQQAGTESPK